MIDTNTDVTLTLEVFPDNEYSETHPGFAVVTITQELLSRIRELRNVAEKFDAYTVTEFDYSPAFHEWDEDEEGNERPGERVGVDSTTLHVGRNEFWWHSYAKCASMGFITDRVSIDGRSPYREHNVGRDSQ